jgi:hypothetical protein
MKAQTIIAVYALLPATWRGNLFENDNFKKAQQA